MAKFRKKPVVIEAMEWTGENQAAIAAWARRGFGWSRTGGGPACLVIETLEGVMEAPVGHYIIRGVKGEFYPCAPDIFAATYEPVEDAEAPR